MKRTTLDHDARCRRRRACRAQEPRPRLRDRYGQPSPARPAPAPRADAPRPYADVDEARIEPRQTARRESSTASGRASMWMRSASSPRASPRWRAKLARSADANVAREASRSVDARARWRGGARRCASVREQFRDDCRDFDADGSDARRWRRCLRCRPSRQCRRSRRWHLAVRATASRPAPWFIQGDPADSLYRLAHDVLNRGDYGRAAQMFKEIAQKYPKSVYQERPPVLRSVRALQDRHDGRAASTARKLLEPRASKLTGVVDAVEQSATSYYVIRPPRHERRRRRGPLHPHQLGASPSAATRAPRAIVAKARAGRREHVRPRRHVRCAPKR